MSSYPLDVLSVTKRSPVKTTMKQRGVRFSDEDWAEVLEMAKLDRRPASNYLRELVKQDVERKRRRKPG